VYPAFNLVRRAKQRIRHKPFAWESESFVTAAAVSWALRPFSLLWSQSSRFSRRRGRRSRFLGSFVRRGVPVRRQSLEGCCEQLPWFCALPFSVSSPRPRSLLSSYGQQREGTMSRPRALPDSVIEGMFALRWPPPWHTLRPTPSFSRV
jgi:hypothetical protein